jgi:hypothetical protein
MKIVICAGVVFSDKIIKAEKYLVKAGHEVDIPFVTRLIKERKITLDQYKSDKEREGDLKYREEYKEDVDMIKRYYSLIKASDAILILNYTKNNVENYIGGSVLMEMAFAYVLDKKNILIKPKSANGLF